MCRYHNVREGLTPPSLPGIPFSFYTSLLIVVKLNYNFRLTVLAAFSFKV